MSFSKEKINQKISFVQNHFEKILELDFDGSEQEIMKSKNLFQPPQADRDYESLGYALDGLQSKRSQSLFAQLSLFFEVGILLQKQSDQQAKPFPWLSKYSFAYGHFFHEDSTLITKVPTTHLDQIFKKTETSGFEKLKCSRWIEKNKFQAFLIPLEKDIYFIGLTGMAEPWLKIHLEKIQKRLLTSDL